MQRLKTFAARNRTAAPAILLDDCLREVRTFSAGSKRVDDVTLLTLQRSR